MSMEARDLMFGDWVLLRHTHTKEKTAEYVYGIGRDVILYRNEAGVQCVDMNLIEPMPLTEEMLINNGFEDLGKYLRLQDDILMIHRNGGKLWAIIGTWAIDIQYVHKLQHLLRFCGLNELADNFKIE